MFMTSDAEEAEELLPSNSEGSRQLKVCLTLNNYIMSHWYLPGLNLLESLELSNEVNDIDI